MNQSSSSVPRPLRVAAQLLMAFSLLLALVAPLAQVPVAARVDAAAAAAPDPSVEPDASELPVEGQPSLTDEPSDLAQPAVDVPSEEAQPSETTTNDTTITIYKWLCPAGYDYTDPESRPDSDCTEPLDGIQFDLTQTAPDAGSYTATTGDAQSGTALFSGFGPGSWELTELPSSYGTEGFRICNDFGFGNPGAEPATVGEPFAFDVPNDQPFNGFCNWYDVPESSDTGPAIVIVKWTCPSGYDYQAMGSDPASDCSTPADGVDFSLSGPGGQTDTLTTGDDTSGQVTFAPLDPGDYAVTETVPSGTGSAFHADCSVTMTGEVDRAVLPTYTAFDDLATADPSLSISIPQDAAEGYLVTCNWYNVPSGNTITIYKWLCPANYDYTDPDSSPEDDCTEPLDGVEFELAQTDPGTTTVTATTGDDDTGIVRFTGFDPGLYDLTETTSTYGTGGFRVCNDFGFGNPGAEPANAGEPFAFDVPSDEPFNGVCDWYNVPSTNSVTIYKWLCPYDYDYSAQDADPALDCTELTNGVDFTVAGPGAGDETTGTTGDDGYGAVTFDGLDPGDYQITETTDSFSPRSVIISCYPYGEQPSSTDQYDPGYAYPISFDEGESVRIVCDWYNVPWDNSITIYKWTCPYDYDYSRPEADPYTECTEVTNAVEFTVSNLETTYSDATGNDGPGTAVFGGLTPATWQIEETLPTGYVGVLIGDCYQQGDEAATTWSYSDGDSSSEVDIADDGSYHWVCNWFNLLTNDPGEVTIYKWTCPAGYDIYAYGANAAEDCTQRTNGVRFNAEGSGYTSQSDTGDSIDGAVYFGGLVPGDYTFTETLPADTLYVFIADCTGTSVDAVHPYPLYVGNPLLVRVNPGDKIVCNWYNVPKVKNGTIVLTKYICSTPTFTSTVNCEIYEGGVSFTLLFHDSGLTEVTDGTTGATGQLTWLDLPPGQYTVREADYAPCRITASQLDNGYIAVTDGTTTYVSVYNCRPTASPSPGTGTKPRPSNSPAGKFPDTGTGTGTGADLNAIVDPATGVNEGDPSRSPSPRTAPASADTASPDGSAASGSASAPSCTSVSGPDVSASPTPSESASDSPSSSPSPSEQEVSEASLAPSPDADVATCDRGDVPARIVVEAGNIDAPIEIIETVDGQMQAPTGAIDASWYRETSRLGEEGPVVIAGHLNYWNTPEGPFYGLATLKPGDTIEVTGEDGAVYWYEVASATQFPSDASPNDLFESVDQSVGGETMVLITCGGEWDTSVSEYNERTVVVATRVAAEDR